MKPNQFLLASICLLSVNLIFSQNPETKEMKRQAAKVDTLYTVDERANIERWFYDRVNEMNLKTDVREDYDRIVYSYIYDMSRLNDKDKSYTNQEVHEKFDMLIGKMNGELKAILTDDQYINHLENFGQIQRSVYKRWKFE